MTDEEVVEQLRSRVVAARGQWPTIAKETGVSNFWVRAFANRRIVDPSIKRFLKVARFLGFKVKIDGPR